MQADMKINLEQALVDLQAACAARGAAEDHFKAAQVR